MRKIHYVRDPRVRNLSKLIRKIQFYHLSITKVNLKVFKSNIKLPDLYIQKWRSDISASSKCYIYRVIKCDFNFENYLIKNGNNKVTLCKFRCGNHKLPITKGRFTNVEMEERICNLCMTNNIGDEFHYMLCCPFLWMKANNLLKSIIILDQIPWKCLNYLIMTNVLITYVNLLN